MRGEVSLGAEFFAGGDQADAEDLFPESVGEDASGERVVFVDEPVGQIETIGRRGEWRVVSGEWRVESGEWLLSSGELDVVALDDVEQAQHVELDAVAC